MRESRTYGSVRGARGNSRPYRDRMLMRIRVGKNRVRAVAHADGLSLRDFCPPHAEYTYCAACAIARPSANSRRSITVGTSQT